MKLDQTDVLIIGSGFGAAALALRLSEAGYEVLVLEKGPRIDPATDFRQTQDPRYLRRYLKGLSGRHIATTFAEGLGGGSPFYEMVSLRAPSLAFEQTDPRGARLWPRGVGRQELEPFYDVAESMLNVEQIPPDRIPRTGLVFSLLMKKLGYSCDRARYAARGCIGSGFCVTGCVYGAKQSLLLNYLPQAEAAGARILTDTAADRIIPLDVQTVRGSHTLDRLPPRYEVHCHDATRPERAFRVRARMVVLGAGTNGTAQLLLESRPHMPLLSHHVGRNITFNGSVKVVGLLPEDFPDGDMYIGQSHPGMISYEFLESHGITIAAAKPLPIQILAGARLFADGADETGMHWGAEHVELMKLLRARGIVLYSLGLTPPGAVLSMGSDGRPRLNLRLSANLKRYYRETRALLSSILVRNGGRLIREQFLNGSGMPRAWPCFSSAHHTGSCRMADSKGSGVVSAAGEVFDYPGLYVVDGACIPSSLAVNTSLTILANAERIAAGILAKYGGVRRPAA